MYLSYLFFLLQFCIILGAIIAVVAPVGGIRTIVVSIKTYKFYSWWWWL